MTLGASFHCCSYSPPVARWSPAERSGRRSNYSIRGRGRALSRPGDPSRRVASNDPQRNRAKAHRPEISLWYRTNVGLIEFKHGTKSASRCLKRLHRNSMSADGPPGLQPHTSGCTVAVTGRSRRRHIWPQDFAMPGEHNSDDETRATARLPGLEIEIVHRPSPGGTDFGQPAGGYSRHSECHAWLSCRFCRSA